MELLGSELPPLELPFCVDLSDRSRGSALAARRELDPATKHAVATVSAELGVGASELILAAVAAVLFRYGRSPQLLVGRLGPGSSSIGPLLVDASDDPSARSWIERTVEALAGSEPADVRLTELADAIGLAGAEVDRHLRRCVIAGGPPPAELEDGTIALWIDEGAGLALSARGRPGRVASDALERFFDHVEVALAALADDVDARVAALSILPSDERDLLAQWNATDVDYGPPTTLVELFETRVRETPGASALACGDVELTYAELNARANRLAHWLVEVGVGPESLVGVLMERSVELVVALYAVLKAGGAYVPLDPDVPAERLALMASEAELAVVLTQSRLAPLAPSVETVLEVDSEWCVLEERPRADLGLAIDTDTAAYVIYTSGSTGRPKGVLNTHRGIVNRLQWMQAEYELTERDCVLQKTPFSFDVSVWEFFWPLQVGAKLAMAEPGGHRDPGYLAREIDARGVSTVHFVPSMLRAFLDDARAGSCSTLRRVICSGEALTFELQRRFFEVFGDGVELHNLYGPTEAAVDVTYWQCDSRDTSGVVPIGRPIANTQIHVLDERLQPLPIGVAGELHIGGVQVARGYVNRPDLTADRFIDDPFGSGRLYRTGDLARWRSDGCLEFLGRTDHQVKIRGNRVELGEIEAVLLQHPRVAATAVTTNGDDPAKVRLIAHYTSAGDPVTAGDLRGFLHAKLPDYMVPAAFVEHDELALTTSGKIDRKRLDAVLAEQPDPASEYVAPRDPLESLLAEIWSEVLEREQVGVDDRFFELGGDSIQAATFVNRVQQELDEFIYVTTAFTAPTIAEYAALLRRDYPKAVSRRFVGLAPPESERRARAFDQRLAEFRAAVPTFAPFDGWREGSANPRAIFVLSPPRSGTSLLRVMLAGHPGLFAASELQLLTFDTLEQRRDAFAGPFALWREGTIRSLMELRGLDAADATELMAGYEHQGLTAKEFYAVLQELCGDRTLVDKSPSYALDRAALDNAELGFEQPFYIHLIRDPHEMVHSFASYHMDQVLFLEDHGLRGVELGELVWLESQATVLDFLEGVPARRQFRLRFEDLVTDPRTAMRALADATGLEFDDALLRPYDDIERKMVDGLHESSTPMGDTRLLDHGRIDPGVADRWRRAEPSDILSAETWQLAAQFGYAPPTGEAPIRLRGRRSLASDQRRRRARRA